MNESEKMAFEYSLEIAEEVKESIENDEIETLLDLILDVQYILDSRKRLLGVRLLRTCGGPTCWIDTVKGLVETSWGFSGVQSEPIPRDVCEILTSYFDF